MNVGMLALMGSLTIGGPSTGAGPLPVPGQRPPAGVARVGAPAGSGAPMLMPYPQPGMGLPVPAPVLPARVIAPKGVRVTAYPGTPMARIYDTPAVLAFRPGYVYRLELSNITPDPNVMLYPEIEVRGTLVPRPGMKYMDYPIPLVFSQGDLSRVLAGTVLTKVIYLEDPEKAYPSQSRPDDPVEFANDTESDAIKNAIANGRLVAIVRLGNRPLTRQVLQHTAIDGTILLPGERYLRSPLVRPVLPYYACPLFDPMLGPKGPKEECLLDGGDRGDRLGIGPSGGIGGLDPTDVGVEYSIAGRRRVTTSNVVCICSPRFLIQRAQLTPSGVHVPIVPGANLAINSLQLFRERHAPMVDLGRERPNEVDGRRRPMAYVGRVGTAFFVGSVRPDVYAQIQGIKVVGVVVEPEELTAYPGCPLTVTKAVDPAGPVPIGETVTITIRYANTGTKPISDVVVNDSLSGRLEYVAGSAQSDRAANFGAAENEAGSVLLRWEFPGTLLPGQRGMVKFKARVR